MSKMIAGVALIAILATSACAPGRQQTAGNALTGAALGAITADILSDDPEWIIIGALTGLTAGTLVARNQRTGQCAYAGRQPGMYYRGSCR
jgi:osmotically inducible lipoprotein OsmB